MYISKLDPERPEVLNRFTLYKHRQPPAGSEKSMSKPLLAVVKSKACSGLQDPSGSAAVRGRPGVAGGSAEPPFTNTSNSFTFDVLNPPYV